MDVQFKATGIRRDIGTDIRNNKYANNGYIKVCAKWVKRLWEGQTELSNKKYDTLNAPTAIFDQCGAYDKNNGNLVARGSSYAPWKTALDFLEWYQVPLQQDFGIIIVDDERTIDYQSITEGQIYNTDCFNSARELLGKITLGSALILISMTYLM